MASFDLSKFSGVRQKLSRYERYLASLQAKNLHTANIERTVNECVENAITHGSRAFVIYGEPQSGKTQMMIGLTARLLDEGVRIVVVLLNDNVQLLKQNLSRFQESGLDPTARSFEEVLSPEIDLGTKEWVIFCKKNANNLRKLNQKLGPRHARAVVDDEADFATPNTRVNRAQETRIYSLVKQLLGQHGVYVGVTATPARLDLNNTFENDIDRWVQFEPHPLYTGPSIFFPLGLASPRYQLQLLPDAGDAPRYLREALFRYFAAVAYLNTRVNTAGEVSYSILVHTSGARVDHSDDHKVVLKTMSVLDNPQDRSFASMCRELWGACEARYPGQGDDLTRYILENISRHIVVVMNSDSDREYEAATNPRVPFTIVIGGNIVSRGVTFNNLLSMFFTRDAKHKIQQDTYIQRARMFGVRGAYLDHFELTIPKKLYSDWHRCFVFHQLSLESIRSGNNAPAWIEDTRIAAVSSASIAKSVVNLDSGEMSYEKFKLNGAIKDAVEGSRGELAKLDLLKRQLPEACFPAYLLNYVKVFSGGSNQNVAVHQISLIGARGGYQEEAETLQRRRGFLGSNQIERVKPNAAHHFVIIANANEEARLVYKFVSTRVKFLKRESPVRQGSLFA